jgi:hypothetical protein
VCLVVVDDSARVSLTSHLSLAHLLQIGLENDVDFALYNVVDGEESLLADQRMVLSIMDLWEPRFVRKGACVQ